MERDYGYVKVRMGPLFPKRNPRHDDYYPKQSQEHQRDARFPIKEYAKYRAPNYGEDHHQEVWNHSDNGSKLPDTKEHHGHAHHERTDNYLPSRSNHDLSISPPHMQFRQERTHISPHGYGNLYPERRQLQRSPSLHSPISPHPEVRRRSQANYEPRRQQSFNNGNQYPEQKQVQRSSSLHRPTSPHLEVRRRSQAHYEPRPLQSHSNGTQYPEHRPTSPHLEERRSRYSYCEPVPLQRRSSRYLGTAKPAIPQPDYGVRSRSVDPHSRSNPDRRSSSEDTQETRHNYRHSRDYSQFKESTPNQSIKPCIPKPDYTWHRRKRPTYI